MRTPSLNDAMGRKVMRTLKRGEKLLPKPSDADLSDYAKKTELLRNLHETSKGTKRFLAMERMAKR